MHLDRIFRRLQELNDIGVEFGEPTPADASQIAALEKKLRIRIPAAVQELYLWGGEDPGVFNEISVIQVSNQLKHDYRARARSILEEASEDPKMIDDRTLILTEDYDGNFSFIRDGEGDDPPSYIHVEDRTVCEYSRFSDGLASTVEHCAGIELIVWVESAEELKDYSGSRAAALQGIVFSGDVRFGALPEGLFTFENLRTLNVVGKGLFDLSPCIRELSNLKRLYLAQNSLANLPMALGQLKGLEELDLGHNQLTTVIDILRMLPNLRYCTLAGNSISEKEINELREELPELELVTD